MPDQAGLFDAEESLAKTVEAMTLCALPTEHTREVMESYIQRFSVPGARFQAQCTHTLSYFSGKLAVKEGQIVDVEVGGEGTRFVTIKGVLVYTFNQEWEQRFWQYFAVD